MTITQLEYIIALDTHRNFVNAADSCFVTQPTLSMQIQKLEDELGVKVFDRSKQPVVPTHIGEDIIAQARNVLKEHGKIIELIQDEKGICVSRRRPMLLLYALWHLQLNHHSHIQLRFLLF